MYIFIILNIIKFIIGILIVYLTYNYINLEKDFIVGVISMGIGIFILFWSISFFLLLGILLLIGKKKKAGFIAYKYTGLFAFYILINFLLMGFNFWNKFIGFIILIAFLILGIVI